MNIEKIKTPDLSTAKVGDKLWNSTNGEWETIELIRDDDRTYPIRFASGRSSTITGSNLINEAPCYFWQPFTIPQECLTRPADSLPANGTMGWGRYQNADGDQWAIGYLQTDISGALHLTRTPNGTTSWLRVHEFTTIDPYKENNG